MSKILQILHDPDPQLRKICEQVQLRDLKLAKTLIKDMIATLKHAEGQGLAAPQVGVNKQIIVVKVRDTIIAMINPKFIPLSLKQEINVEGCLSIPNTHVSKTRYSEIQVSYTTTTWDTCLIKLYGIDAICAQHEIDHLNGVLMID